MPCVGQTAVRVWVSVAMAPPSLVSPAANGVCRNRNTVPSEMCPVRPVELVFVVGWAAFWLYWILAALSTKRGHVQWSRELRIRAVIVAVAVLLARLGAFRGYRVDADPWR